jgi:hypothetical protein
MKVCFWGGSSLPGLKGVGTLSAAMFFLYEPKRERPDFPSLLVNATTNYRFSELGAVRCATIFLALSASFWA